MSVPPSPDALEPADPAPRKLVAYELLSLDGVAEDPDRFIDSWDDFMDDNVAGVIAAQDAPLRRTARHPARGDPRE